MTLTETRPGSTAAPKSRSEIHPEVNVIKEARRRHRRRIARTTVASLSVILLTTLSLLIAQGEAGRGSHSPSLDGTSGRSQPPYLASASTHLGFVLLPTWLPPGFSASGGGWIEPVGGLRIGNKTGVSVEYLGVSPESKPRANPVLFTLSYYGYHNPESKNIRLTATRYGFPPQGVFEALGGRHVEVNSAFEPGYFGGNTNSSASWVEHGVYVDVMAQGITKTQLARFVAGLKERPPPKSS